MKPKIQKVRDARRLGPGGHASAFHRFRTAALLLGAFLAVLSLSSCAEMAREMGIDNPTGSELRAGPTGTADQPAVLDPFRRYDLVMAGNECRYFTLKVPQRWFWKVYLTVAARDEDRHGRLDAQIVQSTPPWSALAACAFSKTFDLGRGEGVEALLGIGNPGPARPAVLRLCQIGAPLHVTIQSQISSTDSLLGPDAKEPEVGLRPTGDE